MITWHREQHGHPVERKEAEANEREGWRKSIDMSFGLAPLANPYTFHGVLTSFHFHSMACKKLFCIGNPLLDISAGMRLVNF